MFEENYIAKLLQDLILESKKKLMFINYERYEEIKTFCQEVEKIFNRDEEIEDFEIRIDENHLLRCVNVVIITDRINVLNESIIFYANWLYKIHSLFIHPVYKNNEFNGKLRIDIYFDNVFFDDTRNR